MRPSKTSPPPSAATFRAGGLSWLGAIAAVIALALASLVIAGCGEKAQKAPEAEKVAANDDAPKVSPKMAAKLALISGKLACVIQQHPEGVQRDEAQAAVFKASGMDREEYEAAVKDVAEDPMYLESVKQASSMCGPATPDKTVAASNAMRSKLKALAVAAQCMAKQGKSGEEMNQVMMAQYRAYDITMSVYAREMAKLTNDRPFQDEVRAAVEACPAAPPKVADAGVDTPAGDNTETEDEGAQPEDVTADAGGTEVPDGTAEGRQDDAGAGDAAQAGGDAGAEGVPVPTGDDLPGTSPRPPETQPKPKPAAPSFSGTWTGTFKGGRLTVRVRGRRVTATVVGGATRLTAKGAISGSRVRFSGRRGQAYAKFTGTVKGGKMSGRSIATLNIGGSLKPMRGGWTARKK